MAKKRSRTEHLRSPFVVTVAAVGASLSACGGQVGSEAGTSGPEIVGNPPPPNVTNPATCPAVAPAGNERCDDGLVCEYGDCNGTPTTVAECVGGAWSFMQSTCNPPAVDPPIEPPVNPPIDPPASECPDLAPLQGVACVGETHCEYGDCYGSPTIEATCVSGGWQIGGRTCNPPATSPCPEAPPPDGEWCFGDAQCSWGTGICDPEYTEASCIGEQWVVSLAAAICNPPPPPETCPETEPDFSLWCNVPETMECTYGDCYGSPTTYATCVGGTWEVAIATCNPPPPPPDGA